MHLSLQDGETTLMKASAAGQMECIKVLLDRGAEVNMQGMVSGVDVNPLPMCRMKMPPIKSHVVKMPHLIIIHVPFNGHYMCVLEY